MKDNKYIFSHMRKYKTKEWSDKNGRNGKKRKEKRKLCN